ncbi:putative disease resistance protein At1g50180 [Carex rostrata]
MADLLLSALVPIVVKKSGDLLAQRISEMWGMVDLSKRLEDKLLEVQDVLTDAEERGNTKPSVRSWLTKLKSAAIDADDILDKYRRQDAVRRGHKIGNTHHS